MAKDLAVNVLAQGLGWFSIGLGLTEVVATGGLTEYLGMEKKATLVRCFGLREITAGTGLLTQSQPAPWFWARVGGDALDLAVLASSVGPNNPKRKRVGVALAIVAAVTVVDSIAALKAGHAQAE